MRSSFRLIWLITALAGAADDKSQFIIQGPEDLRFMVTIDGGSSGTRIHVHTISLHPDSVLPEVKSRFTYKVKPGLSSFTDTTAAADSIRKLLEHALDNVPRPQWRRTPVFLKATAGLRSVTQAHASETLDICAEAIERTAFQFRREWAKVISGKEEGMFGWIAVNYLMQRLASQANHQLGLVGVIEMGGASVQMSFIPSLDTPVDVKWISPLNLGAHEYQLYTHSFLGFGLDQALNRLESSIPTSPFSRNPCLPAPNAPGDFDQCLTLMPSLLNTAQQCPAETCSFNGVYQPSTDGVDFIAIENFFHTSDFFQVSSTPHQLDDVARPFCKTDLTTLVKKFTEESPQDVAKRCFNAAYVHSLLTSGLGFAEPFEKIKFVRDVNGVNVDWAIGSVIYEALNMAGSSAKPVSKAAPTATQDLNFPYVELWVVLLPVAVVFAAFALLRNIRKGVRYTPIRGHPVL